MKNQTKNNEQIEKSAVDATNQMLVNVYGMTSAIETDFRKAGKAIVELSRQNDVLKEHVKILKASNDELQKKLGNFKAQKKRA